MVQHKPTTLEASSSTTTSQTSTITAPPTFDYKAELARLSMEIETTLKKQFKDLFTQMDTKIDNFMKQCSKQHEEQEQFNETMTIQLTYLADNMKQYLKLASPPTSMNYPLP